MTTTRRARRIAPVPVILTLATLLAFPGLSHAKDSRLANLMKETGLHYVVSQSGTYTLTYDGENVPLLQVKATVIGDGPLESVILISRIIAVNDARDWPSRVFPWLLSENLTLLRGAYSLGDDGKAIYFVDKVPLATLTARALATSLAFAASVLDQNYPKIKTFLEK